MTHTRFQIEATRQCRRNFLKILDQFSIDQLNHIPQGFNNNLIWNYGHIIVTQQLLCYRLAGMDTLVPDAIIDAYRKGTKPVGHVDEAAYNQLKEWAVSCLDTFEKDLAADIFQTYKTYGTSFGLELSSIHDAIHFNNVHESMHLGTAICLKNQLL
ncbi:MAG: DinB family protein [Bacteroidota bacterium]